MKKLFTLVVLMSLVGSKAIAGNYLYFTECPQLDFGTTSFDYLSVEEKFNGTYTMTSGNKKDYNWKAETYGSITLTEGCYVNKSDNVYTLFENGGNNNPNNTTIGFTGTGYMIITCYGEHDGTYYNASYMITVLEEGQKRHWDFTNHSLMIGPYNDNTWRLENDQSWEKHTYSSASEAETLHLPG